MADPAFGDRPRKLRLERSPSSDFIPTYPMPKYAPEGNGSSALAGGSV